MDFFTYHPIFTSIWIDLAIFYYGFILYAGLQTAIKERRWLVVAPCAPIILTAGLIDVLFNQSIGRLLFLESRYTLTFSQRLDFHYLEAGWRGRLARNITEKLVNVIFPGHIGG